MRRLIRRHLHPPQLVALSFAAVIVASAGLLSLPAATRTGERLRPVDALFTAASATCVTGLAVVDTSSTFSTFGQIVILSCIQVGGLGLMTFTTVFLVLTGYRLAIADRIAIQESFHHTPTGNLGPLVLYIVVGTFATEALGALALAACWTYQGRFASFGETLYHAVFHAVSAFCNAGFALYPDSLVRFADDPVTLLVFSLLIVAGGLGFLVGLDVKEYVQQSLFRRFWSPRVREQVESIRPRPRLSTHTKLVLAVTAILVAVGTASYFVLERRGLFGDMSGGRALLNAFFCSVTARTAGFNTIDYGRMGGAALLCTMVLMFIGASPGSTGGGIKTSVFGALILYSIARWRGFLRLQIFRRTVPQESIDRAGAVVIASLALLVLASSALMAAETHGAPPAESQRQFLGVLFETVSAFATVGLSMNQTPLLSDPGKLIIIVVMFVGRIGPLTLALAISLRQRRTQIRYVEESIMVG